MRTYQVHIVVLQGRQNFYTQIRHFEKMWRTAMNFTDQRLHEFRTKVNVNDSNGTVTH